MTYNLSADISDKMLEMYLEESEIAIDAELHGLKLYRDEICLVQICDDKKNVCLVRPNPEIIPTNLKRLLTDPNVIKVFHFALSDVAFFKTSMDIDVSPFRCTKVMSKIIRTYTQGHGLKDLSLELLGHDLNKDQQQTNWAQNNLSSKQLEYAANDVLDLIEIYRKLNEMIEKREPLSTGTTVCELNIKAQAVLPSLIELLIHGYGDKNGGWESSLFSH